MVYTDNGTLFSLKEEILTCDMGEDVMLSKISQPQKDKYDMIPLI